MEIKNKERRQIKPEGLYCQVNRVFGESESCPFLDESRGAKKPFCMRLEKYLGWDIAGRIIKECVGE